MSWPCPKTARPATSCWGSLSWCPPAPGIGHQRASLRLAIALHAAARAPVEVLEAVNVILPSGLVVPDLVVADAGATAEDAGGVRLVIELICPGNRTMDRKVKPMLYAEIAIAHFWRLEFAPALMLVVYQLEDGRYAQRTTALAGTITHLDVPFPFGIGPADLSRR